MLVRGQYVFFLWKGSVARKNNCGRNRTFSQKQACQTSKIVTATYPASCPPCNICQSVCAILTKSSIRASDWCIVLVAFSNGSIKVRFRVVVKVDQREDKDPVAIANKVGKTLKNSVETGQLGSFKVKPTVELRGLCCGIDVSFVRCFTESFVFVIFRWLIDWFLCSFVRSSVRSFRSFAC